MGAMQASKQFETNELKTIPLSNHHLFVYFIPSILPQTDITHETKTFPSLRQSVCKEKVSRFRVLEF
jgi:hypothetical protein